MNNVAKAVMVASALLVSSQGLEGRLFAQEKEVPEEAAEEQEAPETMPVNISQDESGPSEAHAVDADAANKPIAYVPPVNTQAYADSLRPRLMKVSGNGFTVSKTGNELLSGGRIDNVDRKGGILFLKVNVDTTKVHTPYTQGLLLVKDSVNIGPSSQYHTLVEELSYANPKMAFLPYDSTQSIDALATKIYNKINMVQEVRRKIDKLHGLITPYPNPFNPETTLKIDMPYDGRIRITVYNILGQMVKTIADEPLPKGEKSYRLDLGKYPSGIYLIYGQGASTDRSFVTVEKIVKLN